MSLDKDQFVVASEQNNAQAVQDSGSPSRAPSGEVEGDADTANRSGSAEPESRRRRSARTKHSGDQLDELRALPEVRPIPWKPGKELPLEASIEAPRVQTRGACLLVTRGEVRDPPCSHCSKDLGRFSLCVASEDFFNGSCATCQFSTRANLCDFRRADTLRVKAERHSKNSKASDTITSPDEAPYENDRTAPSEYEQQVAQEATPLSQAQIPSSQVPITQPPNPNEPTFDVSGRKKRKRRSDAYKPEPLDTTKEGLQPNLQVPWKAYSSPYQHKSGNMSAVQRNSQPSTPTIYSSPYVLPPPNAIAARSPDSAAPPVMVNSVYQKDDIHGHYRHYQPIAQAPRHILQQQPQQQPQQQQQQHHGNRPQHLTAAGGFIAVNRDSTESLSPSAQLLQPVYGPADPHLPVNVIIPKSITNSLATNPTSQPSNTADIAIIDTLTRKKQKQIYSIVGGLQSGIRSCQQQAENMQRQLNLLQAALGIDVEEGENLLGA